jgi:hypothetical protein
MNRRGFLGALAIAPAVGPEIMKTQPVQASVAKLGFSMDSSAIGEALGQARELSSMVSGKIRPFNFGGGRDYVYRTGCPAIDALRSVSGVHKQRMEDKRPVRIVSTDIRTGEETVVYA